MKHTYMQPVTIVVRAVTTSGPLMTSRQDQVGDQQNGGMDGGVLDGNNYDGQQRSKGNVWDSWDD